jgi:hypothetical protein
VSKVTKDEGGSAATEVDVGRRLMAFNWLTAGYAHRDWLGPWADLLDSRSRPSLRLLRRVSVMLLERHDLIHRFVRDPGRHAWLLEPHSRLVRMAEALGTAMLGGWVRGSLQRQEVALQNKVLGPQRRARSLQWAHTLKALPYPGGGGWAVPLTGQAAVVRLGVSCLVALPEAGSGAAERTAMRFPLGTVAPLRLSDAQRDEALALLHGASEDWGAAT